MSSNSRFPLHCRIAVGLLLIPLALLSVGAIASDKGGNAKNQQPLLKKAPKRLVNEVINERLTFSIGSYVSQGDYTSTKPTDVLSIPFRTSYHRDAWSFSAQIPYLYISGPENVLVIREGGDTVVEASDEDKQRQGLGDLRLSTKYSLPWRPLSNSRLNIGAGIKLPTGDEDENLSSGEIDYQVFTGGYIRNGAWIKEARVGYQWMGDTSDTDYNNRSFFSLGGRYLISRSQSVGANFRFKEASSNRSENIRSISATFQQKLNYGWKVSFTAGTGFGESTADAFGGLSISKSFVRKKQR